MSEVIMADPDQDVSAMCHRNHVQRAWLYEQEIPDAQYEPVRQEARSGPVICILKKASNGKTVVVPQVIDSVICEPVCNDIEQPKVPTIRIMKQVLGVLARWGAGAMLLCSVADGLIDTTYGLTLTIVCIGWGLIHLIKVVAHG